MHILSLSREERLKAALLSGWFFVAVATLWLLKSLRITELLVNLGARETPYVRLVGAIVVGAAVLVYSMAAGRLSRVAMVRVTSAVFAVLLGACWVAMRLGGPALAAQRAFVWTLYALVDAYAVVMIELFWTYTNDVVTPEEANRLYGIIGLGGILGGAFGGASVDVCVRAVGQENFLLVAAGAVVVCAGIGSLAERVLRPAPRPRPKKVDGAVASALEGVHEVARSRYLMLLLGVVVAYEFTATLIDFGVNVVFEHAHLGATELARMYGRLGWIASLVAIFAQLVLVPLLLPSKRLALLVPPVVLFAGVAFVVALPVLATAVIMVSIDRGLNYSIQQATRESLYVPLNDTQKYKGKAFIDMFVDHAAKALASLLLLGLIAMSSASPRVALLVSCVSTGAWIVCAHRLGLHTIAFNSGAALPSWPPRPARGTPR